MTSIDRRQFLTRSAAATALAATAPAHADAEEEKEAEKVSPNEVVRLAVIGLGGRGPEHLRGFSHLKDVKITALCDVDAGHLAQGRKAVPFDSEPKRYSDLRRVFDDKDIDAVSIATPNHWHALATIWACQAGKDVYVEKPASHEVVEGRRMVEAARKYGRVVQTGSQCRSHKGIRDAVDFLRSGGIGRVYMAKGLCYKRRDSIGHQDDGPIPEGVDYDLWAGPAEKRSFNANRFHYNWHWFWNTGNGDLGNQGVHQMDIARWGLGKSQFPRAVHSSGGRFGEQDDGETPNTQLVALEFEDALLQFEVRGLPTNSEAGAHVGVLFHGSDGYLAITSYTDWQSYLGPKDRKGPGGSGGGDHFANFIKAVRARDPKVLNADIEEGHLSAAYCHLGNIAYRLGRKLQIDPSTESFAHDTEADSLLSRSYRRPFVVPSKV